MTRVGSQRGSLPAARVASDGAASPALGKVLDFMRLFWAIDQALQRMSKRMLRTLGVTGPQRLVLRIVGQLPEVSAGDLARLLHIHPSTLTGVLARLERGGLIARATDPRDARRSLLTLTSRGRRFDVESEGTVEAAMARALEHLTGRQLDATRAVLHVVADALLAEAATTALRPSRATRRDRSRSRPARRRSR
jgi:DNA-binding MarR family transcriptional regulator